LGYEEVPMTDLPTVSVVVPAHDEAEGIAWAVRALGEGLAALVAAGRIASGEVVVADDHSADDTAAIVAAMGAPPGQGAAITVRTVPVTEGRGLGAAIRAGLAVAAGDLVVYTDADLPFDPDDIGRLIRAADRYEADVVCGYRFDRTVEGTRRGLQSHAYNILVRSLLPVHVRDVNFACKLFRREVLEAVVPELESDGPFIDVELVARCSNHGFRIVQVGVDYFPRFAATSTLGGASAIRSILVDLRRQRRGLRSGR
jgi:cellulose synthase/poly-beta-1,6-N-acetylglucosamine synthase-like glycosyltransferase